jgi:hypothetical protein
MFLSHAREARTEETRICLQQQAVEQQQKTKEIESNIKYGPYPSLEDMGWDNMSHKKEGWNNSICILQASTKSVVEQTSGMWRQQ